MRIAPVGLAYRSATKLATADGVSRIFWYSGAGSTS